MIIFSILISSEYLTRHQAIEWGPQGVRVVCVAPGPIADTEGMRRLSKKMVLLRIIYRKF